jgi:uncharacterized protein (DUF302 family)
MGTHASVENREFTGIRVQVETVVSLDDVIVRLRGLMGQTTIPDVVRLAKELSSEEEYVREVSKRFVGESGFMLFSEIDHGTWIERFGIKRRVLRWILGNPLIAITMIRHDIAAALLVPVEILISERPGGQGATVIYVRPSSLMAIGDNQDLLTAAQELDAKLNSLICRATTHERDNP